MAGHLTTHALDTALGCGARGLRVEIRRIAPDPEGPHTVVLDENGRGILIAPPDLRVGRYELTFFVAEYHRQQGVSLEDPPFFSQIVVQFAIGRQDTDYHVPILFSPYGYSTYRGG